MLISDLIDGVRDEPKCVNYLTKDLLSNELSLNVFLVFVYLSILNYCLYLNLI